MRLSLFFARGHRFHMSWRQVWLHKLSSLTFPTDERLLPEIWEPLSLVFRQSTSFKLFLLWEGSPVWLQTRVLRRKGRPIFSIYKLSLLRNDKFASTMWSTIINNGSFRINYHAARLQRVSNGFVPVIGVPHQYHYVHFNWDFFQWKHTWAHNFDQKPKYFFLGSPQWASQRLRPRCRNFFFKFS